MENQFDSKIALLQKDIDIINVKINNIENTITFTIDKCFKENNDNMYNKMREYIEQGLNNKFEHFEYLKLKEQQNERKDVKKHLSKAVLQWVILGVCGFALSLILTFLQISNTEKQTMINDYVVEIIGLKNQIEKRNE